MKTALHIRRRESHGHEECAAWLVPGGDPGVLLESLAALGLEPAPRVYRLACGFLIRPDVPRVHDLPGALRLAEVAAQVYAPVGAELSPALLGDEVRGLTRGGGVVCLPDGFFSFSPDAPVKLSDLLTAETLRRRKWQALPRPPERPGAIREFIYDRRDDDVENLLDQGGEGIGEEEPRPDDTGKGKQMKGRAEFAAGRALNGLGRALGMDGLQKAGGRMMGRAFNDSPRITEGLLGKQEAALRDLLRKFEEGRTEEALRRALPVGNEITRGARPVGNAKLPFHNLAYSLGGILGGGGGAGMWFTEPDVYAALVREYRKAADKARENGDHRRAAYIYGKLMGDYRSAANALQKGGMHRDAAAIYLKKLNDTPAAARAYESAGDIDEAVRLYRRIGEHVPAGDLLRKSGDEDAALAEYRTGAGILADRGDYKSAGELMMGKTGDPDEALVFFDAGWRARPHPNAVPCAVHKAVIHADLGDADGLFALTDEADRYFAAPGQTQPAAQYYNMLATLSSRTSLQESQAELRDRALTGLAAKLRRGNERKAPFDSPGWSNTLISDAEYALKHQRRRRAPSGPRNESLVSTVRLGHGVVTAGAFAARSGELFVGFEDGRIIRFWAGGGIGEIQPPGGAVSALAVDPSGDMIVGTLGGGESLADVFAYARDHDRGYLRTPGTLVDQAAVHPVATLSFRGRRVTVLADHGKDLVRILRGAALEGGMQLPSPESPCGITAGCVLPGRDHARVLLFGDRAIHTMELISNNAHGGWSSAATHWRPQGALRGAGAGFIRTSPDTGEMAGCNEHGSLYWSGLRWGADTLRCESRIVAARGDFLCAALTGPGRVAGVTGSHVNWFIKEGESFALKSITQLNAPDAVACFHNSSSNELFVLTRQSRLLLVPVPGP